MYTKPKKKMRQWTRNSYILMGLLLIVISITSLFGVFFSSEKEEINKKEVYSYNTKFNLLYDVYLLENRFIEEEKLPMNQLYVTDLIDYLDLTFNFKYTGSTSTLLSYTYDIKGVLEGTYSNNR